MVQRNVRKPEAFALPPPKQFYQDYSRSVYGYVHRLTHASHEEAEDITHDTFVKVFQAYHTATPEKLVSWLFRIARHTAIDALRHQQMISKRRTSQSFEEVERNLPDGHDLQEDYAQQEPVRAAFAQLPEQYQRLLSLFVLKGYSARHIGQMLGMPEGTVKSYLYRARALFKQYYQEHEP